MSGPSSDWILEELKNLSSESERDVNEAGRRLDEVSEEELLKRLADLTPIEYDRIRPSVARYLRLQRKTLDNQVDKLRKSPPDSAHAATQPGLLRDPEPWPVQVCGVEILNEVYGLIKRHVVVSESAAVAIALWVLHTYTFLSSAVTPILAIVSPVKRCGKTTLLELLLSVVRRPLSASHVTPAAIFRGISAYTPTLLIDEADTFLRFADELRGILNSGHRRSMAWVLRLTGDNHELSVFQTFCPKAIASIGNLPDTLHDRSIVIEMRRRSTTEQIVRLNLESFLTSMEPLKRKAIRWADDHQEALKEANPAIPEILDDRAADNWRPLFAIADSIDGSWPALARCAALDLSGHGNDEDEAILMLGDLRNIFGGVEKLRSVQVVEALAKIEERAWADYRHGKPINATRGREASANIWNSS